MRLVRANFSMWWCGSACVLPGFVEAFYIILLVIRFEPLGGICFRQLCFCSLVWSLWCSICYHLWELCYFWAKCYLSSMALEWAVCIKSYLHTTLGGKCSFALCCKKYCYIWRTLHLVQQKGWRVACYLDMLWASSWTFLVFFNCCNHYSGTNAWLVLVWSFNIFSSAPLNMIVYWCIYLFKLPYYTYAEGRAWCSGRAYRL